MRSRAFRAGSSAERREPATGPQLLGFAHARPDGAVSRLRGPVVRDPLRARPEANQPSLRLPAPRHGRSRTRIARIVQWGGASAIRGIGVCSRAKQQPGLVEAQCCGGEMKARIAHVQPMRNRFDQMVLCHSSATTLGSGSNQSRYLFRAPKDCLENCFHWFRSLKRVSSALLLQQLPHLLRASTTSNRSSLTAERD